MKVKISISKIRGIGFIWIGWQYHALWLEWADGGQFMPDGTLKTLWIRPQLRYVHL